MRTISYWLSLAVLPLFAQVGGVRAAQVQLTSGAVGVLYGYRLYSVALRDGSGPSKAIDLKSIWDPNIFFRSATQKEKQPGAYPSIKLLDASREDGALLVNLWGQAYRDDGPVVLVDGRSGKARMRFDISDAGATAAFVPGANRIVAYWNDTERGSPRTAVFDKTSGKPVLDIPEFQPAGFDFHFVEPSRLLYRKADGGYGLIDTSLWKDAGPVTIPGRHDSIVDGRDRLILFETMDADRSISAWSLGSGKTPPVPIDREPSAGAPSSFYFIAGQGRRIVKWRRGDGLITIYKSDGQLVSKITLGRNVQNYAIQPQGNTVLFAVDENIVALDADSGRLQLRLSKVLPGPANDETFLFWMPPPR
jgi:hypothetical protein